MTMESLSPTSDDIIALLGFSVMLAVVFFATGLLVGLLFKTGPCHAIAGIMLKAVRPFRRGDIISGDGVTGTVASIHWFNTMLLLADNSTLLVPNVNLMGSTIVNHTANGTRRIDILFGVGHGGDIEAAIDIIEEVLSKDPRVLAEPAPRIAVSDYDTGGVVLVAQPWVSASDYRQVRSETAASVHQLSDAEGIQIHWFRNNSHRRSHGE